MLTTEEEEPDKWKAGKKVFASKAQRVVKPVVTPVGVGCVVRTVYLCGTRSDVVVLFGPFLEVCTKTE